MEADLHRVFTALQLQRHPTQVYARWYREAIGDNELGWLWSLLTNCYSPSEWVAREFPTSDCFSTEQLYRLIIRGEMDRACLVAHELRHSDLTVRLIGECLVEYPAKTLVPSKETEWWLNCKARLHGIKSNDVWIERCVKWLTDKELYSHSITWHDRLVAAKEVSPDAPYHDIIANPADLSSLPDWFQFHYAALQGNLKPELFYSIEDPLLALDYLTYLPDQGPFRQLATRIYSKSTPLRRLRMRCMTRNFDLVDLLQWMHGQEARLLLPCLRAAWWHARKANDGDLELHLVERALTLAMGQPRDVAIKTLLQIGSEDELYASYKKWRISEDPVDLIALIRVNIPAFLRMHLIEHVCRLEETFLLQDAKVITVLLGWIDGKPHLQLRRMIQNEAIRLLTLK